MAKLWWSAKNVIINNHFAPMITQSLALKKIKGKRKKQQHVANDSFKSKTHKTMDNFLLKKPNEQTNYKFEQKKTNSISVSFLFRQKKLKQLKIEYLEILRILLNMKKKIIMNQTT